MKETFGEKMFGVCNTVFLILVSFICLFPLLNVLAISFSDSASAAAGKVWLWPVKFTFESYIYVLHKQQFYNAFGISVLRVLIGVVIGMAVSIITAYPLAKEPHDFPQRTLYVWFLFITMLFSGGLIPLYMTIRAIGLMDHFLVLILPTALSVWNVILLLEFAEGKLKVQLAQASGEEYLIVYYDNKLGNMVYVYDDVLSKFKKK